MLDLAAWTLAGFLAFWVRVDLPLAWMRPQVLGYGFATLVFKALLIAGFGLHYQSWHRVGVRDLGRLVRVVGLFAVGSYVVCFVLFSRLLVPRSVPLIDGALALLLMGGMRLLTRLLHERALRVQTKGLHNVLIVGAGEAGTMIAREMLRHPEAGLQPVGFLDDDPAKTRQSFVGLPVFGALESLPEAVRETTAEEILIAMPSAPGVVIRRLVELAQQAGVRYRIVPGVFEILSGRISVAQIRDVDVTDLLRRAPAELDLTGISGFLTGKTVMVTGAGGSIGSEIVRQIAKFNPKQVILLGRGENSIYQIQQELRRTRPELLASPCICDVRDVASVERAFREFRPDVVFHAAAHKHVPLMEAYPEEAVLNNIGGTRNLTEAALRAGVQRFVLISTDKAVNPSSVMGASKRVCEYVVMDAGRRCPPGSVFACVRFGNVLGSRGSVIPLFRDQIRAGGPVTVTHRDMKRFFMTIPEASQLVLQAASMAESGMVFVLDMGQPVRIVDLAEDVIRLSGFKPYEEIDIAFTGVRPGEKLFEDLLTAEEGTQATRHEKIFVARGAAPTSERLRAVLDQLMTSARAGDREAVRAGLRQAVPTFRSPGEVVEAAGLPRP